MASYTNGIWTLAEPTCPSCCLVRLGQGFPMPAELGDYCVTCTEERALKAFYASEPYVTWKAALDAFVSTQSPQEPMTPNPELTAWLESNPAPTRS